MIINDNSFPNHVEHQKISEESWSNSSCSYTAVEPLRGGTMVRGCFASNKWASHLSCRSWYIRLTAYFPASHIRLYACLQSLSIFARPHAKPPVMFVIANTILCFSMFANMCFPVFQSGSQVALQFLTCHLDISPGRCWGPEWLPPFAPFCWAATCEKVTCSKQPRIVIQDPSRFAQFWSSFLMITPIQHTFLPLGPTRRPPTGPPRQHPKVAVRRVESGTHGYWGIIRINLGVIRFISFCSMFFLKYVCILSWICRLFFCDLDTYIFGLCVFSRAHLWVSLRFGRYKTGMVSMDLNLNANIGSDSIFASGKSWVLLLGSHWEFGWRKPLMRVKSLIWYLLNSIIGSLYPWLPAARHILPPVVPSP